MQSTPKYYLQVFIYVYPLIPGIAPCIRTEFGAIILPNIEDGEANDSGIGNLKFKLLSLLDWLLILAFSVCKYFSIEINFHNFRDYSRLLPSELSGDLS